MAKKKIFQQAPSYSDMDLVEVEDEVQLADVAKVAVQHFDILMDHLKSDQLIVGDVHSHHKVQTGIPLIDNLLEAKPLSAFKSSSWSQQQCL